MHEGKEIAFSCSSPPTLHRTMMLHCHILRHEDSGTMSQELVIYGGACECNALVASPAPTPATGTPTVLTTPTAPTTAPATTSCSICFSEQSTVEVENKGVVAMKDLKVKDRVYVGSRAFVLSCSSLRTIEDREERK